MQALNAQTMVPWWLDFVKLEVNGRISIQVDRYAPLSVEERLFRLRELSGQKLPAAQPSLLPVPVTLEFRWQGCVIQRECGSHLTRKLVASLVSYSADSTTLSRMQVIIKFYWSRSTNSVLISWIADRYHLWRSSVNTCTNHWAIRKQHSRTKQYSIRCCCWLLNWFGNICGQFWYCDKWHSKGKYQVNSLENLSSECTFFVSV